MRAHGRGMTLPGAAPEIFTIGHSDLSQVDFVELLLNHGITLLIDIRRHPGSRHAPQFGQDALTGALASVGIGYIHFPALGGRRRARRDSPNTGWRNASFRGYADYMETAEFRKGLQGLEELARMQRVAIMCAEAVWWRCHRSMVSDALMADGWQVWHIMSDGSVRPHHFTDPARVVDGALTYHQADSKAAT